MLGIIFLIHMSRYITRIITKVATLTMMFQSVKITYPDQNVGVTTGSEMQVTCNLSAQGLLFPLHDIIPLIISNTNARDDLQLGTNECKM
jgi:hypothetical protein